MVRGPRSFRLVGCLLSVFVVWGLLWALAGYAQGATRLNTQFYRVTYRPPSAEYRVAPGRRFDLIYQDGYADTAARLRRALRQSRPGTDTLLGGTSVPLQMPVVVDGFSDLSNGFVTPVPFKQEIEAPSLRSNALVTRSSSWPTFVGSHELVHAMHAEINAGVGYGGLLRLFAPDAARALNLTAPSGLVEGIAVYRESHFEPRAGRLNAPLFTMKMRAAMLSDDPWSLTQMMESPSYTQPFNRHYIGGAHAVQSWIEQEDRTSAAFFRKATRLHNRLPVLGYGVGLWYGLGQWPGSLKEDLRSTWRTQYRREMNQRRPFTETQTIAGRMGHNYRRPYWIDEDTLVTYLHGYDVRAGFYRVDAETGERTRIRVQSITEDYTYSLGRDTSALYSSRFVPDPWVPSRFVAEAERIDLQQGTRSRLTDGGRVFAPVESPNGGLWAIQNDGSFTQWARLDGGEAVPLTNFERTRFKEIEPSPAGNKVAVLLNVDGTQRLYRVDHHRRQQVRLRPWLGLQDAVIYDVSWGPEGRYLLFSSDLTGVANIYSFDTRTNEVRRLTQVPYGALEPALSPRRETVAFVEYQHERHELVRIPFRTDQAPIVDSSRVLLGPESPRPPERRVEDATPDSSAFADDRSYQAWRHLAPRVVYPTLAYNADERDRPDAARFEKLGVGLGVGLASSDPLQRWRYRGNLYWQDGRIWGTGTVQTGRWLLRPSLTVFNTPETVPVTVETSEGGRSAQLGLEERGASVGVRLPIRLQSNIYQSLASVSLDTEYRQTRFFGDALQSIRQDGSGPSQWRDRITLSPRGAVGIRLQQNPRDIVPNQGLILRSRAELDVWTNDVPASRALTTEADLYLPVALRSHTGVRLSAGLLTQNRGAIVGTSRFVPRGYENQVLGAGSFLRLGAEVTQPLWYIDDGSTLIPFYAKALYGYGFGQTLTSLPQGQRSFSSVGAGLGFQFRVFYAFDINLQVGAALRVARGDVEVVWR